MKKTLLLIAAATPFAFAPPAVAQEENIVNRVQALTECELDPNYLGYLTYEICVEARYQDLQQGGGETRVDRPLPPAPGNFDHSCRNGAASRAPCPS